MFHNTSYPLSNIHSLKGSSSFIYIIFIPGDNAAPPDLRLLSLSLSHFFLRPLSFRPASFSNVLSVRSCRDRGKKRPISWRNNARNAARDRRGDETRKTRSSLLVSRKNTGLFLRLSFVMEF